MKGTLGRLVGIFEVSCCVLTFFWGGVFKCHLTVWLIMQMFSSTEPGEKTQDLCVCSYCNGGAGGLGGLSQHW